MNTEEKSASIGADLRRIESADRELNSAIADARRQGRSWRTIGMFLGISTREAIRMQHTEVVELIAQTLGKWIDSDSDDFYYYVAEDILANLKSQGYALVSDSNT